MMGIIGVETVARVRTFSLPHANLNIVVMGWCSQGLAKSAIQNFNHIAGWIAYFRIVVMIWWMM